MDREYVIQRLPLIDAISMFYELLISKCLLPSLARESDLRGPCQLIFFLSGRMDNGLNVIQLPESE